MTEIKELAKYDLDKEIYKCFAVEIVMRMNYGFKFTTCYTGKEECPICLESMEGRSIVIPRCGNHRFHYECLLPTILDHRLLFCPECTIDPEANKVRFYKYGKDPNLTYPDKPKPSAPSAPTFQSAEHQVYENYYESNPSNTALVPYQEKAAVPTINVSQYDSDTEKGSIYGAGKFYKENDWNHNYAGMFM
jgi:hypothetical protein